MNERFTSFVTNKKMKVIGSVVCGALLLTIGTGAVFAASGNSDFKSLFVKNNNGNASYSTDGGTTWNDGLPEGTVISEDGMFTVTNGDKAPVGNGYRSELAIRNFEGVTEYSTDGGQTWSTEAPDSLEITEDADGKVTVKNFASGSETSPDAIQGSMVTGFGQGSLTVKNENGQTQYSTDGGETWNDGLPEGFNESILSEIPEDAVTKGRFFISPEAGMNSVTEEGSGKGMLVKNENGVFSYSEDDGETWTEGTPDGMTFNETLPELSEDGNQNLPVKTKSMM